jgi:hypothetical protein
MLGRKKRRQVVVTQHGWSNGVAGQFTGTPARNRPILTPIPVRQHIRDHPGKAKAPIFWDLTDAFNQHAAYVDHAGDPQEQHQALQSHYRHEHHRCNCCDLGVPPHSVKESCLAFEKVSLVSEFLCWVTMFAHWLFSKRHSSRYGSGFLTLYRFECVDNDSVCVLRGCELYIPGEIRVKSVFEDDLSLLAWLQQLHG